MVEWLCLCECLERLGWLLGSGTELQYMLTQHTYTHTRTHARTLELTCPPGLPHLLSLPWKVPLHGSLCSHW